MGTFLAVKRIFSEYLWLKNIQATSSKLSNPNFKDKAPPEVVNKVEQQLIEQQQKLAELKQQLEKIEKL